MAAGATVVRNHTVTGYNEPCLDCLKRTPPKTDRTHQFHLRVAKVDGRLYGPDASHLQDLINLGLIRNTVEASARIQREVEIGNIRGITPTATCPWCKATVERNEKGVPGPFCPAGHRTYLPELAPRTTAQIRRFWAPSLAGGEHAVQQRELDARRDEVGQLREAVKEGNRELVEALREVMAERTGKGG